MAEFDVSLLMRMLDYFRIIRMRNHGNAHTVHNKVK